MSGSPSPALPAPAASIAEWLPSLGGAVLVRVRAPRPPGDTAPPALVVRVRGEEQAVEAMPEARFGAAREGWQGAFLVVAEIGAMTADAAWLRWRSGARTELPPPAVMDTLSERRARRAALAPAHPPAAPAPPAGEPEPEPDAAWSAHRTELESELARTVAALVRAREESKALVAEHAEELERLRASAGAEAARAEAREAAARARLQTAIAAAADAEGRVRAEAVARVVLEDALDGERGARDRLQAALDAERVTREAVATALTAAQSDLRAAQAGREAEAAARETLAGELDAEQTAHAVTRAGAEELAAGLRAARTALDSARAELAEARAELDGVRADLRNAREAADALRERLAAAQPERESSPDQAGAPLLERIAELDRLGADAAAGELQRRASEQAVAAAAARRPGHAAGRLLADLDAAAAALRAVGPLPPALEDESAPTRPAVAARAAGRAGPPEPAPPRLRSAIVALAREEPGAAGELLAQMLPAQGPLLAEPVAYDLTIRGHGTFAVTVARGVAEVRSVPVARPRAHAAFHLAGDPVALAELLAGEPVRIGRLFGRATLRGRRIALRRVLSALQWSGASLADAAGAGAVPDPLLAHRILAHAVEPAWTRGHAFTVLHLVADEPAAGSAIVARDGGGLVVTAARPDQPADATVTMTRATFARLLRAEPVPPGERPVVRGDLAAVEALRAWTDRILRR